MLQSQSIQDQKSTSTFSTFAIETSKSNNNVHQEWQISDVQMSRLDKTIIRFSSWKMFFQCILMIPSFAVPLYFGVHYLGQCPIQPLINTYLIIHSFLNLANILLLLLGFISAKYIRQSFNSSSYARHVFISSLIGQLVVLLLSIACLIAGQIWVFGARSNGYQSTDPTQSTIYCHSTLFLNALIDIFVTYSIWLILILVSVGIFIVKRYKAKRKLSSSYNDF